VPATLVIGSQWGDEAKAKIVDLLSERADIVVRFQGGANAGHTVWVDGQKFVFHLLPSGILRPHTMCVMGNGVAIDLPELVSEMHALAERGVEVSGRLLISHAAHLVMPYHKLLDRLEPTSAQIATTGRGIGPCYRDKVGREGIRIGDLLRRERFIEKVHTAVEAKNRLLVGLYDHPPLDPAAVADEMLACAPTVTPLVTDTAAYLNDALDAGRRALFEGAQGTLLDVDHGTYPYVTSSNTLAAEACLGAGVAPARLEAVLGVTKAYTTRVGTGPFPSELNGGEGDVLRERGQEYGATTGRPRRCGWLDAVVVRHAVRLSGITGIALTRLDVLDAFSKLKLCTGYRLDRETLSYMPPDTEDLARVEPIYEEMEGWREPITEASRFEELPRAAKRYVERVSELVGAPVEIISVRPDRDGTILM
jgi:adenylosuccinate synthase